jgi:hypothetical protein
LHCVFTTGGCCVSTAGDLSIVAHQITNLLPAVVLMLSIAGAMPSV